jgi:Dolichyl-phosphate-mannose-protein mannosyltransferase
VLVSNSVCTSVNRVPGTLRFRDWLTNAAARMPRWPFSRNLNWWLAVLMGLAIVRFWVIPLPSSFWVDEMGTVFVVEHGGSDPTLRVAPQVPASIYYVLPAVSQKFFGPSEIAYRVPSLLMMGIALMLIARIAALLIHPQAGWFAAFACLFLRDFNFEAADARPYALANCVIAAALYFLIRWLNGARWKHAALFALFAALVWRVHLVLWPTYLLFAIYAAVRLRTRDTAVRWWQAALIFAGIGVSLLPVLGEALAVNREAGTHVVVDLPTGADLFHTLKLTLVAKFCLVAAALAWFLRWGRAQSISFPKGRTLILGWWLVQPLCLFAYSWFTGNSVFVSRYLYVALPGAALAATLAAAAFVPPARWKSMAVLVALVLLVAMGRWNRPWLSHSGSDWRQAARSLEHATGGQNVPVICPSPFIEAKSPVWQPGYSVFSFLYSHLLVYHTAGRLYAFPHTVSPEAARFAADLSSSTLPLAGRFFIFGGDRSVRFWRSWFISRPEFRTWRSRRIGLYGDVELDEFARPHDSHTGRILAPSPNR